MVMESHITGAASKQYRKVNKKKAILLCSILSFVSSQAFIVRSKEFKLNPIIDSSKSKILHSHEHKLKAVPLAVNNIGVDIIK
jgi:hypothetical protein